MVLKKNDPSRRQAVRATEAQTKRSNSPSRLLGAARAAVENMGRSKNVKSTIDTDWFAARMRALRIPSWAQVARDLGIEKSMMTRSIQGSRVFTAHDLLKLARVFNVPVEEMYRRTGHAVERRGIKIAGVVRNDGRVSAVTKLKGGNFDLFETTPNSYAIVADIKGGDSNGMSDSLDGAAFIYIQSEDGNPTPITSMGRICVVEAEGHPMPILGSLAKGSSRNKLALRLLGSDTKIELEHVHRVSQVIAIIFP